jgi:hypothetical protein
MREEVVHNYTTISPTSTKSHREILPVAFVVILGDEILSYFDSPQSKCLGNRESVGCVSNDLAGIVGRNGIPTN